MYIDWQSNGMKRLLTSIVIVLGLASALALRLVTVWIFDAVVLLLAFVAVWEILKAKHETAKSVHLAYIFAYIVIAYTMFVLGVVTDFKLWLHIVMQAVALLIFIGYTMLMNYMDKNFVKECTLKNQTPSKAAALTAVEFLKIALYPFLLIFSLIPLNHLGQWATAIPVTGGDSVPVPMVSMLGVLLVFMISCFTDTFAYLVGRTLKGRKLCPNISPKKTITGAIGGIFGGVTGALLALLILASDGSLLQAFLTDKLGGTVTVQLTFAAIGLVGSFLTQAGDIYASWLKRRTGIKDFGKYLPGHGGAMDRLDGISWNAAFLFLVFTLLVFL